MYAIEPRPNKRLLGIFRCSGWGPGCSRIKHATLPHEETEETSDTNMDGLIVPNALKADKELFDGSEGDNEEAKWGSKKVPIYTLTSGKCITFVPLTLTSTLSTFQYQHYPCNQLVERAKMSYDNHIVIIYIVYTYMITKNDEKCVELYSIEMNY